MIIAIKSPSAPKYCITIFPSSIGAAIIKKVTKDIKPEVKLFNLYSFAKEYAMVKEVIKPTTPIVKLKGFVIKS